jgi:O-antigen/teichoic acid export membrane protein
LHLLVWSRPLILLWLGPQYTDAVAIVRILLIAVIPYTAFVMLRSIIDAVEVRAINTLNLLMALAATAAASALALRTGLVATGLAGATAAGFWILALLTLLFLWKRLGLSVQHLALGRVLAINAALMVPALVVARGLESRVGGTALLAGGALTEGGLLLAYCWLMWVLNVRWAKEMMRRIAPRWESGSAQPERTCD